MSWAFQCNPAVPGGCVPRPTYADGRIYAFGDQVMDAIDAKTGQPVLSFGNRGRLRVLNEAVSFKYPGKEADGYRLSGPPAYFNGTLYTGLGGSHRHIPGGVLAASRRPTRA